MLHQPSDSERGAWLSAQLKALQLPKSLEGRRVLNLACNEGFFCFEAMRRGAARAVGIDADELAIQVARARCTHDYIEFLHQSSEIIPEEVFDIVILSGLHRLANPRRLLEKVHVRLSADGILILECAFVDGETRGLQRYIDPDGSGVLPTRSLEERNIIVEGYALTNEVVQGLRARLSGQAAVWVLNRIE